MLLMMVFMRLFMMVLIMWCDGVFVLFLSWMSMLCMMLCMVRCMMIFLTVFMIMVYDDYS